MGLKILHSADWHLDSPLTGFSPEQRAFLRKELLKIPGKVADICRREGCELVLLAGDLFDGPATRESILHLKAALAEMAVPVFISPGNHDFVTPDGPWMAEAWPKNVHIFRRELESVCIPQLDCRVYGAGYTAMDCPGLLENFRSEGEESFCVAVLHGDGVNARSPYCPVTAAQVRDSGLDYLALGHVHQAGSFRSGSTLCGWPGCPMGRGWDETGEKGVYLAELGAEAEIRFLPLDGPQFIDREVDCDGISLRELLAGEQTRNFIRLTLRGADEEDISQLRDDFPNLILRDLRTPAADLWEKAGEDTLEGIYFRLLREKLESDGEIARLAAEVSRKLLDGREVTLP